MKNRCNHILKEKKEEINNKILNITNLKTTSVGIIYLTNIKLNVIF